MTAAGARTCGTGKLLDVETSTETIGTPQVGRAQERRKPNGDREWITVSPSATRQKTIYRVTVALGEMIYTAESNGDLWGYNPAKLVVNDPIDVCAEGRRLIITRSDGKQYKPAIIRTARLTREGSSATPPVFP